ncbi:MAG: hypothetical protein ACYC5Q_15115 [Thermoleophilia bacterium]
MGWSFRGLPDPPAPVGTVVGCGVVPRFSTIIARLSRGRRLVAEAANALALIAAGIRLLRRSRHAPPLGLVANGMLAYTVIVGPGYFAQNG